MRNRTAAVGAVLVIVLVLVSFIAPLLSPYSPAQQDLGNRLYPPNSKHLFGTDSLGRDILSRVIYGSRISLAVGFFSVLVASVIGVAFGLIAGYAGGITDLVLMRVVDVLMSFPVLIMGLFVMSVFGPGTINLIVALAVSMSPRFARISYGPTLAIKEQDFILAAKASGAGPVRVIVYHLLPNILGEILVMGSLWIGTAILIEASLSFLGLGVTPPTPTWGNIIREGLNHLRTAPWIVIFSGGAIFLAVISFNMMGDGIRDIADPKLSSLSS